MHMRVLKILFYEFYLHVYMYIYMYHVHALLIYFLIKRVLSTSISCGSDKRLKVPTPSRQTVYHQAMPKPLSHL